MAAELARFKAQLAPSEDAAADDADFALEVLEARTQALQQALASSRAQVAANSGGRRGEPTGVELAALGGGAREDSAADPEADSFALLEAKMAALAKVSAGQGWQRVRVTEGDGCVPHTGCQAGWNIVQSYCGLLLLQEMARVH